MDINGVRKIQDSIIDTWRKHKGVGSIITDGSINMAYTTYLIVNKIVSKNPKAKILILNETEVVANKWYDIFTKYGTVSYFDGKNITCTTFEMAKNFAVDVLIVNSASKIFTSEKYRHLVGIRVKYMLCFSQYSTKELENFCPIIKTIDNAELHRNTAICRFVEYNVELELSEEDREKYDKYSELIKEINVIFDGEMWLIQAASKGLNGKNAYTFREELAIKAGWSKDLDLSLDHDIRVNKAFHPDVIGAKAMNFMEFTRNRGEILTNNPIKLNAIKVLLLNIKIQVMIFNKSNTFANSINTEIVNVMGFHGNLMSTTLMNPNGEVILNKSGAKAGQPKRFGVTSLKRLALAKFNKRAIVALSCGNSVDKMLDVSNVSAIVFTSPKCHKIEHFVSKARNTVKFGFSDTPVVPIVNLYFKDTIESKALYNRQKDVNRTIYATGIDNAAFALADIKV